MKTKLQIAAAAVATLSLTAASVSQATPTLRISDGLNTVTVTDNGVGDTSLNLGQVNYANGSFFGWNVLVSSGVTKPILGSATSPALDLTFQVVRGAGSQGTLSILFSENDFNLSPAGNFGVSAGGALGNLGSPSVNVQSFYDLGNATLALTTPLTAHLYSGQGGFSGNETGGPVGPDSSVSFTIRIDLSEPINGLASGNVDLHLNNIPEGGSMATFLGTGLLALGVLAARRKPAHV